MTRTLVMLSLAGLLVSPMRAAGVGRDHLACYKMKDPLKQAGVIDLDVSPLLGVEQGCAIAMKSLRLCAPAAKTVVELFDASVRPPVAKEPLDHGSAVPLDEYYLCYKLKCPKRDIASFPVTDQFGARDVEKLQITEVCVPTTADSCEAGEAPACGGTCPEGEPCTSLDDPDVGPRCICGPAR